MKKKSKHIPPSQKKNTKSQHVPVKQEISKIKRVGFTIVMLIFPVLFFLGLEGVLSLVNYGGDLKLIRPLTADKKFLQLNYGIGKKYFPKYQHTTAISYDVFHQKKPANAYRIFVFGGSSAAGYPYLNNGAFSRMLRTRLQAQFPERIIEVVNTAMPAVNTFTVLDFVKELVDYQPDAFLFYTGHNEFYGALGAGSTETLGQSRTAIKFYLFMQNFRTMHLFKNLLDKAKNLFSRPPTIDETAHTTLMEQMVGQEEISYGDETFNRALTFFRENLTEIIQISQQHKIDILFGELVSNIRHQKPFISVFQDHEQQLEVKKRVEAGLKKQHQNDWLSALAEYRWAAARDPEPAITYYLMGQCFRQIGETDSARIYYYRAKDQDALRFRAPEVFNDALREVCQQFQVPVVPLIQEFESQSPARIIGNNLMADHLHPNLAGYFLMACSFARSMQKYQFITPAWKPENTPSDSLLREKVGVTELDLFAANHKIKILKGGWPFKAKGTLNQAMRFNPQNYLEKIVKKWQRHQINWEEAHVELAEHYFKQKKYEKAAAEYQALLIGTPYNEMPYLKYAETQILQKKYALAVPMLEQSLKIAETAYAYKWLGTIKLNNSQAREAIVYLEKALKLKPGDQQALYNLSGARFMAGEPDLAIQTGEQLHRLNPRYPGLQEFMAGLKKLKKK